MAALERAAPMRHPWRDLDACRLQVAHQEFHQLSLRRRSIAGVVQGDLQRPDHVPPVGLLVVDVPGLGRAWIHERVAPLTEMIEKSVGLANDLAKESPLIGMGDQLLEDNTFYGAHRISIIARGSPRSRGRSR